MSRFSVGDKVRIKDNLQYTHGISEKTIANYRGKVYTISRVNESGNTYKLMEDKVGFDWLTNMLEPDDKPEMVNHPQHYAFKYEPIDVINDWGLDFNLGNTVKYIARCERKGNKIQDLEKAKFYLEDEIRRLKENE